MQITEVAAQILARAERRAENAAHNITNASTPGYRRRVGFEEALSAGAAGAPAADSGSATDFTVGQLVQTGSSTDLAIAGEGFFAVRGEGEVLYTRQGQFVRDGEGRLVTSGGLALQALDGGDLIVGDGEFGVSADGLVTRRGEAVGRIGLYDFGERSALAERGAGLFEAAGEPAAIESPAIRQGMIEGSNVSTGDEMVAMMEAVRRAETGQRLVNTWDDLMGRALNLFGQQ